MFNFVSKLFDLNRKEIESLKPIVEKINGFETSLTRLSDDELAAKTPEFRLRLSQGESLETIVPEAFATIRESINRKVSQRAFDVQLVAALTLHSGKIAEQKTGEGKTLSAALAGYVNSLPGKGVHIVTVNDYLARVGAGWYGRALTALGLKISCIVHEQAYLYDLAYLEPEQTDDRLAHLKPITRREAYEADITYGTNNEFGFDYLRDNLVSDLKDMVQRGHNFAIVDEVDSILIDEARTPLIISAPDTDPTSKYYDFAKLIGNLSPDTDYVSEEKTKTVSLSEHGIRKVEKILGIDNLYEKDFETIHHIENALKAKVHFLKDRDYVVKDGEVIIVDEFTGRMMQGRRWSEGLHQAVEAKESVTIQQESRTLATISFQNYFRMYTKLAGMTGTAATEAEEFKKIYNLDVNIIPTNRPMVRKDYPDVVFKNQRAKYAAIVREIEEYHGRGQPVLVGTTSVSKNEIIDQFLNHKNVSHKILNAKQHEKEAQIISQAGEKGAITIATNMAGRGVDIELGGTKPKRIDFDSDKHFAEALKVWQVKHDEVLSFGGLHVVGTERHESRRIDNQLRGRSGRQGDPGSSRFYLAMDDDLMRIFGGEQISNLMTRFNIPEDTPLEHGMVSRAIEQAQVKVEGFNFDMRKNVVEYDDVMNKQREVIYKLRQKVLERLIATKEGDQADQIGFKPELIEIITKEVVNLVGMYAPEGYSQTESDKIVLAFCEIIPFDVNSQGQLKGQIKSLKSGKEITDFLTNVITQTYDQREQTLGFEVTRHVERFVYLTTIDKLWMDHLTAVDELRQGIGLRGYGQRDPLVEYKKEAFAMFESLVNQIDYEVARKIFRVQVGNQPPPDLLSRATEVHPSTASPVSGSNQTTLANSSNLTNQSSTPKQTPIIITQIGRNDPCPCGATNPVTGKTYKYKKCGMINATYHRH